MDRSIGALSISIYTCAPCWPFVTEFSKPENKNTDVCAIEQVGSCHVEYPPPPRAHLTPDLSAGDLLRGHTCLCRNNAFPQQQNKGSGLLADGMRCCLQTKFGDVSFLVVSQFFFIGWLGIHHVDLNMISTDC